MKPFLLLLALAASALSVPSGAQEAPPTTNEEAMPARIYSDAHVKRKEAENLRKDGDLRGAYLALQESFEMYGSITQQFPEWNLQMVAYRVSETKKELESLEAALKENGIALPTPGEVLEPDTDGEIPREVDPKDVIPPDSIPGAPSVDAVFSAIDVIRQEFQTMRDAYGSLYHEHAGLNEKFTKMEADYQLVFGRVALAEQSVAAAEQKVIAAEAAVKTQADQSTADLAALKTEWEEMKKELEVAKNEKEKLLTEMPDMAEKYAAQLKDLETLKAELDEAKNREKSLHTAAGDGGLPALLAAKNQLEMDLAASQTKLAEIEAAGAEKDKQILKLKADWAKATQVLATVEGENDAAKIKVAELSENLRAIQADHAKLKSAEAVDPALRQEKDILQNFIVAEIRRQTSLQQTKNVLLEELKKMNGLDEDLLAKLREIARPTTVPAEVTKVLQLTPEDLEALTASAESGIHTTLLARQDPTKDAPPESTEAPSSAGEETLKKARAAFDANQLLDAEKYYFDYLRTDPTNSQVLASIGAVELRLNKTAEAEVHLSKAVANDDKNAFAHFMLGVLYFNARNTKEADMQLSEAIKLDPSNAKAHHYLGIISSGAGDHKRAEEALTKAVALDPKYTSAHFNLSVLYATMPEKNWEKSREHYQTALTNGAKRDKVLEGLLEGQFPGFIKTAEAQATTTTP